MRLLVTGSIAYDILLGFEGSFADTIHPEELERLSVSYFSPHYVRRFGGSGANVAWHIRLLGGDPMLVGAVGSDGDEYLRRFVSGGINVQHIHQLPEHVTATAIIGTDRNARQIAFYHPGADSYVAWPDLNYSKDAISHAIVSPRDMGQMITALHWCSVQGIPVIFDPGQQVHMFANDELRRLTAMSHGLIANAYEWSIIAKTTGLTEREVAAMASFLVVTHSENGMRIFTADSEEHVPACIAAGLVNPTGAGDALRAGFLYGLSRGWTLRQCGMLGAAIASFVVEQEGTQLERLDRGAMERRMERAYGEMVALNHEV